jgi:hypothetical protein
MFSEEEHLSAIKPLFPDLDDEFLWNVIFEKGMSPDGSYNPERVINYLLGLKERENPEKKSSCVLGQLSGQSSEQASALEQDIDVSAKPDEDRLRSLNDVESDQEYDEKDENIFSQLANMTFFNMGEYEQLKQTK